MDEPFYIEHGNWLLQPLEEWSQFFHHHNWYTFHPLTLEIENDVALGGFEITFIVLGIGLRWRWNYTETEKMAEIKRAVSDIQEGCVAIDDLKEVVTRANANRSFG